MADVFEDHPAVVPDRTRLWEVVEQTPFLDWLMLTKRPENIPRFLPPHWQQRPRDNVWLGTSVEDEERGLERIPKLVQVPAVVRFLSCEPLLSSLNGVALGGIDWVIVGGESGPGARRLDPLWAHALRERCQASSIAFFFKQAGTILAREWGMTGKGHEWLRIPEGLRAREYPVVRHCFRVPATGTQTVDHVKDSAAGLPETESCLFP